MIQYSTKEGDCVCDFFLGGFSTAKAAIGLNRRAIGFEISTPVFDRKIPEIEALTPGSLFPLQRIPVTGTFENSRKPWTDDEIRHLTEAYTRLLNEGLTKKTIIAQLGEELGRGHWAIVKALKKNMLSGKRER
jgi:site-specific DNA-methyltransferase (adenine-specific)